MCFGLDGAGATVVTMADRAPQLGLAATGSHRGLQHGVAGD